ncbi:hypothetical protein CXF68_02355 [Tenacibaculum sp. Bg11-29]|uniref:hypothetical protein n=1 Tax=Tenacibaculum sp. Bg11-29 TaxID=2058306 RepID=UPI000C320D08|nr:hypothetical protein [Tenacibaculum sp. Bg11-29]PKH49603.1 hypothetical protein CXF68_02355 [Tenacibaculum sp. Bg11-29]
MEEINEIRFLELLTSAESTEYTNFLINFENYTIINLNEITTSNKFINCNFIGERVAFMNSDSLKINELTQVFYFDDCEFENEICFVNCYLKDIKFLNISKPIKEVYLSPKKLGSFTFECAQNLKQKILIDIKIHNIESINHLKLSHLKSTGDLMIDGCNINILEINDCAFNQIDIIHSKFSKEFLFTSNIIETSYIQYNEFEKSNFSSTNFGIYAKFRFNEFKGVTLFKQLKNESQTKLKLVNCNFYKYTNFNNSNLYELHIGDSNFQELTSFQELELNSIFLDRTIFEKIVFFDDIVIHKFNECNKRTLRNIKQQLLRADNKIDYDNFRAHELNSFKEELKNKLKSKSNINRQKLCRDLTILRINSFFSNNGTDWVKATQRTMFVAVLFYSIFYGIHNHSREIELFSMSSFNEYMIGLFRYFLLTDFHNPLISNREYLISFWEWIPFVFGKILIGIGIYHVLVSFRKFRK